MKYIMDCIVFITWNFKFGFYIFIAHPTLLKPFIGLRSELNSDIHHLEDLSPNIFLAPFLDVIRSDVVTGHVTGLALNSIQKLLSYELLHVDMKDIANAVENISDAVTHAR